MPEATFTCRSGLNQLVANRVSAAVTLIKLSFCLSLSLRARLLSSALLSLFRLTLLNDFAES